MRARVSPPKTTKSRRHYTVGFLAAVILLLFWRSLLPDYVHFSNDGPLGQQNAAWQQMPGGLTGLWSDLNYIGGNAGTYSLSVSTLLHVILSPVAYAKFYPVIALFLLGLGAWTFFCELRLSALAAALGALAAMLHSTFFSGACWGVASQEIAVGMDFFALALIVGSQATAPTTIRLARLALAGLCIGINVVEAADIGALLSVMVALFALFHAMANSEGGLVGRALRGVGRVLIVTIFALFIAIQAVLALVGVGIQGVAGASQDAETKARQYDWATQWSLPKQETLGLLVPGLFGYKLDTPKDMEPALQDAYASGCYWGGVGRAPVLDRYFDNGSQGPQPSGPGIYMRFTGGGNYCGVLVLLVAAWAIAQSLRRQNSVFPESQKRAILFWAALLPVFLLLAWGRFAPFYAALYQLPYFSTIRNPAKFLILLSFALVIIFAFGIDALSRRYLVSTAPAAAGLQKQFKSWWAKAAAFDRRWTVISLGFFLSCVAGWLIYAGQKPALIQYLQKVGFPDLDPTRPVSAPAIAAFSIGQAAWFLVLLAITVVLLLALLCGYFNGTRAKAGTLLLGTLLLFDLGRADLPWIIHWDIREKYEVGSLNPVVDFLRKSSFENRVSYALPFPLNTPRQFELFQQLYGVEWTQHQFPYYNIQCLDMIQNPRPPEDMARYEAAFQIQTQPGANGGYEPVPGSLRLIARHWQLTNTRYLLGPAPFLNALNQMLDPVQNRFRILTRFDVLPKPGISVPEGLTPKQFAWYLAPEKVTAVSDQDGDYALFEFTGALPRAGLYSSWQANTNDTTNLKTLADLNFDPQKIVLVSTPENNLPITATNDTPGTVNYRSYAPKHIVLSAQNAAPAVLLLNDRFDSNWRVTVDGKPTELLRCNFIMRGVYLPTAGQHTVDFSFSLPHRPLYVTLAAFIIGLALCGCLFAYGRRQSSPPAQL